MQFHRPLILLLLSCLFGTLLPAQQIDPQNVTIARDAWGTPHIFGKTDAEVAYGLAWANSEDNFDVLQEVLLTFKGMNGRVAGADGAKTDFFVHAIRAKESAREYMKDGASPEYLRYLLGYCQGINDYAEAHPDEVTLKKLFPLTPLDIITGYVVSTSALSGVAGAVGSAVTGKYDEKPIALGSNAFAMSSAKTEDGRTYLCINPHFRLTGPFSFYDAHLQSEQGLNMSGAIFQGGTSIFMGNNENLGWGMTWNYFDRTDVFKLKMHEKKKLTYELDGEWKKLEKRPVWLKVKVGPFVLPVKKTTYWSEHGPVLKSENGEFYAVRSGAMFQVGAGEQFYKMDKAKTKEEFLEVLDMQRIAMFNMVYADKNDNIFYLSNGLMPNRNPDYDYSDLTPGNKSEAIWQNYISVDSLPQVHNPSCGYVYNTNNTVWHATCEGENDNPERLPRWVDTRYMGDNNRSVRLKELIDSRDLINFDFMKLMKFDNRYSKNTKFYRSIAPLFEVDPADHPDIKGPLEMMKKWDLQADMDDYAATLFEVSLNHIFTEKGYGDGAFIKGLDVTQEELLDGVRHAKSWLEGHHGTWKVPLRALHHFPSGGTTYPSYGFPDVLAASYAKPNDDGTYHMIYGDSYMHFVSFDRNGPRRIESLLPYGPQFGKKDYKNQLEMYNRLETKRIHLDKTQTLKEAIRIYHPGEKDETEDTE